MGVHQEFFYLIPVNNKDSGILLHLVDKFRQS